jgi:geranylgeranylglycerol-phosphate geranylgeranyltransferase
MRGDSLAGGKTLPILIGKTNAARLVVFFFIISVILSIIPIFSFFSNNLFYLIVAITDIMLLDISKDLFFDQSLTTLRKGRKLTLFAIVVGLFAFLLAALFK